MIEENVFGKKIGNDQTWVKQSSFDLASRIVKMADGLTYDEYVVGLKLALQQTEEYFTLKAPLALKKEI